ncbi:MAG: M48 family metalloprotease, partial [Bacteroidota bacterium]
VHLMNCSFQNAFSLPDGHIYFTVSLYEALGTDDGRAFVLAHELGHCENQHGYKNLSKTRYVNSSLSDAFKPFFTTSLLQVDEMEADLAACYLSYKAGYDPAAAVGFFYKTFRETTWKERGIFERLGTKHLFHEERYGLLLSYLDIARQESLNQWEIKSQQPVMAKLRLYWLGHKKRILIAGAFLMAIALLVMLRRRAKKTRWKSAVPFCFLFFLAVAGACCWFGREKKTGENECNCAGKVRVHKAVLRESPSIRSHVLAVIPYDESVWLESYSKWDVIDGRRVKWRRVKWGSLTGYVWDWLVEKQNEVTDSFAERKNEMTK